MVRITLIFTLLFSSFVFSQDGELDLSFANNGIYNPTNLNFTGSLLDLSVDSSNNIYISGNVVNSDDSKSIIIIKLLPDGEIDNSFGNNGSARVHYSPTAFVSKNIILENGKIILVGWINSNTNDFLIIGLNSDGSLDQDFGDNGRLIIDSGYGDDKAFAVAEYNNSLFVGGYFRNQEGKSDFSITKLNMNGVLDLSFGENGIAKLNVPTKRGEIKDFLITDTGDIVATGKLRIDSNPYYSKDNFAIVKFDQNGNAVSSFGNSGLAIIPIPDGNQIAYSIKKFENSYYVTGSQFDDDIFENYVIVTKINNDGDIDLSFGTDGILKFGAGRYGFFYGGYSSILQDNNKLIIGGLFVGSDGDGTAYKRINSDGTLDQDFGTNGTIIFDFFSPEFSDKSLLKQFDDKYLSLGIDMGNHLFLTRHNIDQSLSVKDSEINNLDYSLYPNPATDELFIKRPTSGLVTGNLFDITGKLILNFTLNNQESRVKVENLAAGIYFLEISDSKNTFVKKIIKL